MEYDLKTPCKNCPFRTDETRITFQCRERAEEIEEQAYRLGFPCHLSAVCIEDPFGEEGFHPGENTQHCIGAIIMYIKSGEDCWPGIDNDEDLVVRLWDQIDLNAPVFESPDDFLDANTYPEGGAP